MDTETAATPADDGPVTLVDAVEAQTGNQDGQQEAQTPAGDADGTLDDLTQEALGKPDATPEEEIEVEFEGDKRKLPPKWRDAFLREQDYRRKTMDVSEQRKAFEQERQTFTSTASLVAQNFQDHVKLGTLNAQINDLKTADITYWTEEDIAAGNARLMALQQQAMGLQQNLSGRLTQQQRAESENVARLREACLKEAAARVPNFTETRQQELEQLAIKTGVDPKEVATMTDPWAYELLHFADIGKKFIERQKRASQMRNAHAGAPATMLGSAASGGKSPEDMSPEEYMQWRSAGNG